MRCSNIFRPSVVIWCLLLGVPLGVAVEELELELEEGSRAGRLGRPPNRSSSSGGRCDMTRCIIS